MGLAFSRRQFHSNVTAYKAGSFGETDQQNSPAKDDYEWAHWWPSVDRLHLAAVVLSVLYLRNCRVLFLRTL